MSLISSGSGEKGGLITFENPVGAHFFKVPSFYFNQYQKRETTQNRHRLDAVDGGL